jgi:hypothetical protein
MSEASYETLKSALESDLPEQIELRVRRERRRRWTPGEKLRIVQEAFAPGAVAKRVAERYEISTGLLFTWRQRIMVSVVAATSGGFGRFYDPVSAWIRPRRTWLLRIGVLIRPVVRVLVLARSRFWFERFGDVLGPRSRSARSCPRASSPARHRRRWRGGMGSGRVSSTLGVVRW